MVIIYAPPLSFTLKAALKRMSEGTEAALARAAGAAGSDVAEAAAAGAGVLENTPSPFLALVVLV